jgi:hypothetical protein
MRLVHFAGNLKSLQPTNRGFQFSYDSNTRCIALLNKQPFGVLLDGKQYADQVLSHSGLWSIRLPSGKHGVEILADSTAIVILEKTSLYGSNLIFVFGTVACGLMLLIYFSILARRAVARSTRGKMTPPSSHKSSS